MLPNRRSGIVLLILIAVGTLVLFNLSQRGIYDVSQREFASWLSQWREAEESEVRLSVQVIKGAAVAERFELSSSEIDRARFLRMLEIIESGDLMAAQRVTNPVLDIAVAAAHSTFRSQIGSDVFIRQVEPALFLALLRESQISATSKAP